MKFKINKKEKNYKIPFKKYLLNKKLNNNNNLHKKNIKSVIQINKDYQKIRI